MRHAVVTAGAKAEAAAAAKGAHVPGAAVDLAAALPNVLQQLQVGISTCDGACCSQ